MMTWSPWWMTTFFIQIQFCWECNHRHPLINRYWQAFGFLFLFLVYISLPSSSTISNGVHYLLSCEPTPSCHSFDCSCHYNLRPSVTTLFPLDSKLSFPYNDWTTNCVTSAGNRVTSHLQSLIHINFLPWQRCFPQSRLSKKYGKSVLCCWGYLLRYWVVVVVVVVLDYQALH